jgi:nitroreductase
MTNDRDVVLQALRRTRQVRRFTDQPVDESDVQALLEVARWSGSSQNSQQWQFIVIRDPAARRQIGDLSRYARYVANAPLAIAIAMPGEDLETDAYDEGRVAERLLIAANAMGLGGGIAWTEDPERLAVGALLGITPPTFVRTIVALGYPTEEARQPRTGPGAGRRPLSEFVRDR